jgi:hypothetical protein
VTHFRGRRRTLSTGRHSRRNRPPGTSLVSV